MLGTATKLKTARTIGTSGAVTGTATSFNGTANITIPTTAVNPDYLSKAVPVEKGGTGNTTGNATTATKLKTARKIALTGAVAGSVNFDGSGNVSMSTSQNNIFVLSGNISANNRDISINYPSGYNVNNCIVISCLLHVAQDTTNENYTLGTTFDTVSYARGGVPCSVSLGKTNIKLRIININLTDGDSVFRREISDDWSYRIVLMKIS